jgi:hypothetical protein
MKNLIMASLVAISFYGFGARASERLNSSEFKQQVYELIQQAPDRNYEILVGNQVIDQGSTAKKSAHEVLLSFVPFVGYALQLNDNPQPENIKSASFSCRSEQSLPANQILCDLQLRDNMDQQSDLEFKIKLNDSGSPESILEPYRLLIPEQNPDSQQ